MKIADMSSANIVTVFNNMEIELELIAKRELDPQGLVNDKELPEDAKVNEKYFQYIVVKFQFRSVPHSVQTPQGYQYRQGGRVEIKFNSYGLSEKEMNIIKESEKDETYKLIDEMVGTSLSAMSEDLQKYMKGEEDEEEKKSEKKKEEHEPGPLGVMFSGFKELANPLKHIEIKGSYFDRVVADKTRDKAGGSAFTIYDVYKKAHGMMSF